jgi:GNAT superfamily N-acetyltransferase
MRALRFKGLTAEMTIVNVSVCPLNAARQDDFYRVHSSSNGADWCYCVAWWVPTWDCWGQRTASENRALREKLFRQKRYDGYILYVDGAPVGWCHCGQRDRLAKLLKQYNLEHDPNVWAITCLLIAPRFRKRGLAHRFLAEILKDLKAKGIQRAQAFPRRGDHLPDEDVWTGPERLYRQAGFVLERDDPVKPIYGKWLTKKADKP